MPLSALTERQGRGATRRRPGARQAHAPGPIGRTAGSSSQRPVQETIEALPDDAIDLSPGRPDVPKIEFAGA
jgi:hypothetical protein